MEGTYADEIVISGVGGCFPRANNLEELKEALLSNDVLLDSRWAEGYLGVTNKIGKVDGIEKFDNIFFGINAVQANLIDPMHRKALEKAYEAIMDAGYNINEVKGRNIASFAASSVAENGTPYTKASPNGYVLVGQSRCMASNRLSYFFNLKGPSILFDENWVGSGRAVKAAYDAIKSGYCEAALVTASKGRQCLPRRTAAISCQPLRHCPPATALVRILGGVRWSVPLVAYPLLNGERAPVGIPANLQSIHV